MALAVAAGGAAAGGATEATGSAGSARHPYRAWVVLAAAIVVWELVDYAARGSRGAHPTLSSMADALDRFYVLKAALFFGWLSFGALVVRLGEAGAGPRARPGLGRRRRAHREREHPLLRRVGTARRGRAGIVVAGPGHPWPGGGAADRSGGAAGHRALRRVVLLLGLMWLGWHLFAR